MNQLDMSVLIKKLCFPDQDQEKQSFHSLSSVAAAVSTA